MFEAFLPPDKRYLSTTNKPTVLYILPPTKSRIKINEYRYTKIAYIISIYNPAVVCLIWSTKYVTLVYAGWIRLDVYFMVYIKGHISKIYVIYIYKSWRPYGVDAINSSWLIPVFLTFIPSNKRCLSTLDKPLVLFLSAVKYSISQEICTRFLLCCALLWLYIDWFSHIHQAYFTGTVAI